ncbi:Transposase, IS4 family (plasmid) [Paraburkholderia phenoliruptrix BR3459a]|uniref:Transposase, IS4 family n=1 Tax=Paraburkholderia phenoliruptrix BR3459a TaxID=1229205 RepID=K0E158_9BURK|nr:Transposase, IS4 family [Paraburkholderia phenoliruptrix BR3459a]
MRIRNEPGAWVDEEFETLVDGRAKELLKRFAARPTASIPGACEGWAETMAEYGFLGNEHIDWRDMMQPHWDRTTVRMEESPVVLCVADTTEL